MERTYAFIDECGGYGFDFSKQSTSNLFIVAAIIVKEANLAQLETEVDLIRKQEFNGSEIKSNGIKGKHTRRVRVLNKVLKLPFNILTLIVDKREVLAEHGIYRNKKYFYEFINNLVYKELRGAYPSLHIVTDEVGEHEFASVFSKYVKSHRKPINLFDMEDFDIVDSKSTNGVQLADLIAGTLSYIYDDHKKKTIPTDIDYLRMLEKKLLLIKFFPKSYDEKLFEHSEGDNNYNKNIALLSYRKAEQYVTEHTMSSDEDIQRQVFTLKYLLFRFKYNNLRRYISTKELMNALLRANYSRISEQAFRSRVIGTLRDRGVIISSSPRGYKLPSTEKEIIDYYQHVSGVVLPMLHRLNLCDETLRLGTNGDFNILCGENFKGLSVIIDAMKKEIHNNNPSLQNNKQPAI